MKKIFLSCFLLSITNACLFAQINIDTSKYIKGNPNIYALIIAKDNKLIKSTFYNGRSDTSLFNDQSLTKGICSLLMGIAIEKHFIKSIDQKIVDFFPELANDPDTRKLQVTIRQVMNQASGLYHEDLTKLFVFLSNAEPSGLVLKSPLMADPGKEWHYNNAASHLISVILTKATKMDTKAFSIKYLFEPLGITHFEWAKMRDGYYDGSGLLAIRMQSTDLTKIALMMLNKGVYNNRYKAKQLVPAKWINLLLNPNVTYNATWGFDNSKYALDWYHINYKSTAITYGMGWGGQFMVLIPAMKSVIIINQNTADNNAIKQSNNFIENIFPLIYAQLANQR